ncbi:MAG: LytTR family transcriptional regulator [Roseivirga sp.]|nr:LytTR family transcriptional regulator [Roseivirga sp.]
MQRAVKSLNSRTKQFLICFSVLLTVALVANHLTLPEFFPTHPDYEFPLEGFLFTMILGSVLLVLMDVWYRWFEKRYFLEKVGLNKVLIFLGSSMGLFAFIYLLIYPLANYLIGAETELYYFLNGFLISLLLCFVALVMLYGGRVYKLSLNRGTEGKLKVISGNQTIFVWYEEIAYLYSMEKIVYLIKTDGERIVTSFVLNKLEEQLSSDTFFRANRQTLIHRQSVIKVLPDVNGKKSLKLLPAFLHKDVFIISRYKAKEFDGWLHHESA